MKTKIIHFGLACWNLCTEVPGWPDAPRWMRWRRALPLLVPCAAMVVLSAWTTAIRDPQIQAERASHQGLFALEEEIASLGLAYSEQQALEITTKSAEAANLLLAGPADLGSLLIAFRKEAAERRWEANFQAADVGGDTAEDGTQVLFLPVRGKLSSPAGNPGAFTSLIALIDRYSSTSKRIDLTRLAIRADEQGRYTAELNLRLAHRRPHEKTTQ